MLVDVAEVKKELMGSQNWSVVVTWAMMASVASMVASMASMASMVAPMASMDSTELLVVSMTLMDASMASLASMAPGTLMALASGLGGLKDLPDLSKRKLNNEMLRFSRMENWLGSLTKQTWADGRSRSTSRVGVVKMKKELMGSLIWFVVMTQIEEGADGLSDMHWLVASMDGVGGWRRWWTGVFDTEGTDVEVPLCPQW